MTHPPLQRHMSLQPLSRDHQVGLIQAQRLLKAADGDENALREAVTGFLAAWRSEISVHFADEERLLPDLIPDPEQRRRLLDEHVRIRAMTTDVATQMGQMERGGDAELLRGLGQLLNNHIRWEERELFPVIERAASPEQLAGLTNETQKLEQGRPRSACQACAGTP